MKRSVMAWAALACLGWGWGAVLSARGQDAARTGAAASGSSAVSGGAVNERFDLTFPSAPLEKVLEYVAAYAPGRPNILVRAMSRSEEVDLRQMKVKALIQGVTWETALDYLADRYKFVVVKDRLGDGLVYFEKVPRVSETFLGVRLGDAVGAIARRGNANIVFSPDVAVDTPVTLSFTDVPWRAALNSLLKAHKCTALEEDNGRILRIATMAEAEVQFEIVTRQLRYIQPEGPHFIAGVVSSDKSEFIARNGQSGSGGASTLGKSLLQALDMVKTPSLPNRPETGGRVTFESRTNTLVICDTPVKIQDMLKLVDEIDRPPDQVHIKTRILTKRNSNNVEKGVRWSSNGAPGVGAAIGNSIFNDGLTRRMGDAVSNAFQFGKLSVADLNAVMRWAETDSSIAISQVPEILVLDNEEASVFIGSIKRYILTKVNSTSGSDNMQTETDERELLVGVQLMVIPHICSGTDQVVLEILPREEEAPEMNTLEVAGSTITYPSDNFAKYAHTKMMLRSGETGIIAGLIHDQTTAERAGVPVLSRLPVVRLAFNRKEEEKYRAQTTILVTPTIIPASHDGDFQNAIDKIRQEASVFEERPAFVPAAAFPQAGHRIGRVSERAVVAANCD